MWSKTLGRTLPANPFNAVAAMPKGATSAGMKLELRGEKLGDATDWIELHYIAFLGEDQPRDGQDARFEPSL